MQTPNSVPHITRQERDKKKVWEQLKETHRSWNPALYVCFEPRRLNPPENEGEQRKLGR